MTEQTFQGNWARSEHKREVLRALSTFECGSAHARFISNYNLNFIKYLLLISIFVTFAGGHKCIKEHLEYPKKSGNPRHSAKVLNSDFYLCPHSKPHLHNFLIDFKDFLTQTAQGRRHTKSKIKLSI